MKHVVSVSSGVGSAYLWHLVSKRHESVVGLFADVNGEHEDNYRFLSEVHAAVGGELVRLDNDGRTIWDVFRETRHSPTIVTSGGTMIRFILLALLGLLLLPSQAEAHGSDRGCGGYSGRAYILCKESGLENMPNGLPPGAPHPGASSASGPCGMLASTRRAYGGDDLDACTAYMLDRYGSWDKAERFHRRRSWW